MVATIRFGTDGWRGIIAEDFTFGNVRVVSEAIARYLKEGFKESRGALKVVVGYDTRFLSEEFARTCTEVLVENGIRVCFHSKPRPTPLVAFSIKTCDAAGAVMFTASHNPAIYNGIKFIPSYAGPATSEITDTIEKHIEHITGSERMSGNSLTGEASPADIFEREDVEIIDPVDAYIEHLKGLVDFKILQARKLKVVVDPLYGAGQGVVTEVFKKAGCRTESMHGKRDVLFGSKLPDPSFENLQDLTKRVLKKKADLGLALDGDGDRFGAVDARGTYFSPNHVLALLTVHLLKRKERKGAVVRSVATTHILDRIAAAYGAELYETPVGFKHIGQMMREKPVVIGGEESGGLSILGHIPEKDGILADLLLAEMVAYEHKTLSQLLDEIYKEYGYHATARMDIHCSEDKKAHFFESMKTNPPAFIGDLKVKKVDDKDGLKFYLAGGNWALFRASGTEPLVRIYVEGSSKQHLQELKNYSLKLFKFEDQYEAVR